MRPKKQLGQHFLVDENILGVIGRLADLQPDDVVLEVGPGLGVLTRYLAARVAHVHAVELDRSLEPELRGLAHTTLHWRDALALDPAALDPPPSKLVANLPYNIATPLVVESLDRAPAVERVVRDGAARGRRALLRPAGNEGIRCRLRARAAGHRAKRLSRGLA